MSSTGEPQKSQRVRFSMPLPGPKSLKPSALVSDLQPSRQSTSATEPKSTTQSMIGSEPQSSNLLMSQSTHPYTVREGEAPNDDNLLENPSEEDTTYQKWGPKEWDNDVFDSDDEHMSLGTMRKLVHELCLLKETLEDYKKFNDSLGDKVSGPRHKGYLQSIFFIVAEIGYYTNYLNQLRHDKKRGNMEVSETESVADQVYHQCDSYRQPLWDVMADKVDMTNLEERVPWVKKKDSLVGEMTGKTLAHLEKLNQDGRKEKDLQELIDLWEKKWIAYGAMDLGALKKAGWILDVGK